ncbi:hypothetical protein H5410_014335 [Solanum commersonii]|uniref:Uncharacterized protein n=1 Tax=Solanum commersonii TaxID=4109 RepID=A0A9J5ZR51_SOLCO|nr:hypothetical protein H5410_014335 [Solanum commersonii]
MIPYSHTEVNQFKIRNQMQRSHSKRGTQCMLSPICLPLFSNRLLIRLTQDKKGLSKAFNEVECKMLLSHMFIHLDGLLGNPISFVSFSTF